MKNLLFPLALLMISCSGKPQNIKISTKKIALKEVSGIEISSTSNLIWAIEDSGNPNKIYGLDTDGKITHTLLVENATNNDWEDLATDRSGNLYIGDFGNNDNKRRDLCIYKINAPDLKNEIATSSAKISFYYPEQTSFPPKKSERFYDAEAFFEYQNYFYIFTKNRSKGFDGTSFLYKVPNKEGEHKAILLGRFQSCSNYNICAITAASISPDGKKIALLSSNKIWVFSSFSSDAFLDGKMEMFELNDVTQKEGICFKNNETLLLADEKNKKTGGNLYEIKISDLKPKP